MASGASQSKSVPIAELTPSPYQPRERIRSMELQRLAESIQAQGLVQPIIVREVAYGYEIVAGERRWRAADLAGLTHVPVIVRDYDDNQAAQVALIENIQREDLNPIETAQAIQRIMDHCQVSQTALAQLIGMTRSDVSHYLRLLKLTPEVREWIAQGRLSLGHGKALATLAPQPQRDLAQRSVDLDWSVRRLEQAIRAISMAPKAPTAAPRNPDVSRLETELSEALGAPTRLDYSDTTHKGELSFTFHSLDELDGILQRLGVSGADT